MKRSYPTADPFLPILKQFEKQISLCVKCGACRAVCPTFLQEREESLSARGRMALIKAALEGNIPLSRLFKDRLASCTGCLACEAACPSGVPVTEIIQIAKEQAVMEAGPGIINTVLAGVVKNPDLFRAAAWLAPLALHYAGGRNAVGEGKPARSAERGARNHKKNGKGTKGMIAFFPGCAITHFHQDIGAAVVSVLNSLGYGVVIPEGLKCCGRPLLSLGDRRSARELAAHNSSMFVDLGIEVIVTACASCGLTFKHEYPKLLPPGVKGPAVLDIHEFLFHALAGVTLHPVHKTVTWHDPCHLGRGQGIDQTARRILCSIPGITYVEMMNADRCCGFGGMMRITHRKLSDGIVADKVKSIIATDAEMVVTGCPSCRMQIANALRRRGRDVEVVHTVQVLEQALRNVEGEEQNRECALAGARLRDEEPGKDR